MIDVRIGLEFKPTFPSNIDHYEVRGYDEERKMVLTKVYPKKGEPFDDEIEEIYYQGAFNNGDYVKMDPARNIKMQEEFLLTSPYAEIYENMGLPKPHKSINNGPCCGRCKNRYTLSDFCDKHEEDEKCYRFKFDKKA